MRGNSRKRGTVAEYPVKLQPGAVERGRGGGERLARGGERLEVTK